MTLYQLEICANSVTSALAAQAGGATRVELCQHLEVGGITPSHGQIQLAKQLLRIGVHVLIRPRAGDFLYTDVEFEEMKADIGYCRATGCAGVVIGLLRSDGSVDEERLRILVNCASPMQVTFHRAFDRCRDPLEALEAIIRCGCNRLLTSGMKNTALEGTALIGELVKQADGRVEIMPGSGIDENNVLTIAKATGAHSFHTSARESVPGTDYAPTGIINMGSGISVSSKQKIRLIADLLNINNIESPNAPDPRN
ncbi:copper homeostasis protein CutC [Parapedobacter lycopersici]|uniref:copper homeostasis protein CutC n=1 Tax=Parapedobacter lycopersici TaxID=1864939 RepID=UPI00214DD3F4|nr:copper homeostasis protein CutC [Parapedobacter lycopersici]